MSSFIPSLYIHIPFCDSICVYCDFTKRKSNYNIKEKYIECLINEIIRNKKYYSNLKTIYIGGGTPSSLEVHLLEKLLNTISNNIKLSNIIEYTFESNPESLSEEKIEILKKYGVNRVSLGVQTFNDKHLKFLGRKHKQSDIITCIEILNKFDITNINIDLIFSLPNQSEYELIEDLNKIIKLGVNHISCYSLIIEENTILHHLIKNSKVKVLNNDIEAKMFEIIIDFMLENNFNHYEISNFCKKDSESKHNLTYWNNNNYIGLGLGSSGYINNTRYKNTSNLAEYLEDSKNITNEVLSIDEIIKEEVILGLRKIEGFNIYLFNSKFKINIMDYFPIIDEYIKYNLLIIKNGFLRFTKDGLFKGNYILEKFI